MLRGDRALRSMSQHCLKSIQAQPTKYRFVYRMLRNNVGNIDKCKGSLGIMVIYGESQLPGALFIEEQ